MDETNITRRRSVHYEYHILSELSTFEDILALISSKRLNDEELIEICNYLNQFLYSTKSHKKCLLQIVPYLLDYNIEQYLELKYGYYLARYAVENMNIEVGMKLAMKFSDYILSDKDIQSSEHIRVRKFAHFLYETKLFERAIEYSKAYELQDMIQKSKLIYEISSLKDYEIVKYYESTHHGRKEIISHLQSLKKTILIRFLTNYFNERKHSTDTFPTSFISLNCEINFIDNITQLSREIERFSGISEFTLIGFDIEFISLEELSLLQISYFTHNVIVDLLAFRENNILHELDRYILMILKHPIVGTGLKQDISLIVNMLKLDVQISDLIIMDFNTYGKKLLNTNRTSLKNLCLSICGCHLNKSQQCSNWKNRPLSTEQLEYASLDAHIALHIVGELKKTRTWDTLDLSDKTVIFGDTNHKCDIKNDPLLIGISLSDICREKRSLEINGFPLDCVYFKIRDEDLICDIVATVSEELHVDRCCMIKTNFYEIDSTIYRLLTRISDQIDLTMLPMNCTNVKEIKSNYFNIFGHDDDDIVTLISKTIVDYMIVTISPIDNGFCRITTKDLILLTKANFVSIDRRYAK